jgi:SAM-dependent methyltransferase
MLSTLWHCPYREEFDAVFSNAVLHWIKRADEVIAGVHRCLRPGGRFVAECGGFGCVDKIRRALVEALDKKGISGEARVPAPEARDRDQPMLQ